MTLGATLGTALLVVFTRPSTWILALAGFLIRGGIVWFVVPIVILPTPVVLSNVLGPTIVDFVLGGATFGVLALLSLSVGAAVAWLVAGGLFAALIEVELIRIVSTDEEVGTPWAEASTWRRAIRVLAVRLVALAPLLIALLIGTTRIVAVTYGELTLPGDVRMPIAWRVLLAVPESIAVIALAWLFGEVVGAIAARRVVFDDGPIGHGLVRAVIDAGRRPLRTLGLALLPLTVLLLVLIPVAAAATVAWGVLRDALTNADSPLPIAIALVVFLGLWAGGLILAGAVCAWRGAVWTVAMVRRVDGTFGVTPADRPGDWNPTESSGTL